MIDYPDEELVIRANSFDHVHNRFCDLDWLHRILLNGEGIAGRMSPQHLLCLKTVTERLLFHGEPVPVTGRELRLLAQVDDGFDREGMPGDAAADGDSADHRITSPAERSMALALCRAAHLLRQQLQDALLDPGGEDGSPLRSSGWCNLLADDIEELSTYVRVLRNCGVLVDGVDGLRQRLEAKRRGTPRTRLTVIPGAGAEDGGD